MEAGFNEQPYETWQCVCIFLSAYVGFVVFCFFSVILSRWPTWMPRIDFKQHLEHVLRLCPHLLPRTLVNEELCCYSPAESVLL